MENRREQSDLESSDLSPTERERGKKHPYATENEAYRDPTIRSPTTERSDNSNGKRQRPAKRTSSRVPTLESSVEEKQGNDRSNAKV
jgi:hypothetical protein